jgi:hypothetical protein
MLLEPDDVKILFKLHRTLMFFVNQRLKVIPNDLASPEELSNLPTDVLLDIRDAFSSNIGLIDSFVEEVPHQFSESELDIVRSWRHLVAGKFFILRDLKKHTVFLSATSPFIAYGVMALSQPFENLIGPRRPFYTEAVLLPFNGRIVYDSMLSDYGYTLGPGVRRALNDTYKEAKAQYGIVTLLPISDAALPLKVRQVKPVTKPPARAKNEDVLQVVIGLINQFCDEHLNEEYAVLCRRLALKLGSMSPTPLLQGSPNAWASGIVRAVGGVNFLQDKSQTPYMRSADIDHHLGASSSSASVDWP